MMGDERYPPPFLRDYFTDGRCDTSHGQVFGDENGFSFWKNLIFDLSDFLRFAAPTLSFSALHCTAIFGGSAAEKGIVVV